MSDDLNQHPPNEPEFGLSRPIRKWSKGEPGADRPIPPVINPEVSGRPISAAERAAGVTWKGFEEEEVFEPEVQFTVSRDLVDDDMDMTPMVDVTFLLLIFFMITASFTIHKAIEQPPLSADDPSMQVIEEPEQEDDYVEIIIDQFNTYRLTSRSVEELEAPSDQEMRVQLRNMVNMHSPKRLIITAHGDSHHAKVVAAWDAGTDNDIHTIEIRVTDEDF